MHLRRDFQAQAVQADESGGDVLIEDPSGGGFHHAHSSRFFPGFGNRVLLRIEQPSPVSKFQFA